MLAERDAGSCEQLVHMQAQYGLPLPPRLRLQLAGLFFEEGKRDAAVGVMHPVLTDAVGKAGVLASSAVCRAFSAILVCV